jgi:hypothetical protein
MKRTICLLACWLVVLAASASAGDWHDQSNYPARVIAFTWGDGSAQLDSNHPATFGSWTVSFSPRGLPLMRNYINRFVHWYITDALVCSNAVAGKKQCQIQLTPAQGETQPNDGCWLILGNNLLPTGCPSDITFQH